MNSIHTALFLTRETIMIFPLIVFCFIPVYSQITVSLLSLIKKVVLVTFLVEIVMFIFFLLLFHFCVHPGSFLSRYSDMIFPDVSGPSL